MTKFKTKYNRRSFLKVSAAAGGGMVLGVSWLASCNPTEEKMLAMPDEWHELNTYIKIGENGVVSILSPNPEIGQNVKTSMPMIVAEELDVDWNNVVVEQAGLNDWFSRQVAGGSQSIRQEWDRLRMGGATARKMLVEAAAKRWEVDAATLTTENGVVKNTDGKTLTYGELATEAAEMEVPAEAELKDPKDFKIIGTSRGNVDIKKIVTGQPLYGLDYKREGMVHAVVMRPPAFGQKLDELDDTEARAVNGVQDVIKFAGGNKIAVLASSTWAAIKGKKALKTKWSFTGKIESSAVHDAELNKLLNTPAKESRRKNGDVAKAFAEADEIVERTYSAPFLPHNCMEPMNFFAHVTDEKADLHGPIQTPAWTRSRVASLLGYINEEMSREERMEVESEKVHIGMTRMGGGFGRRLYGGFALEAAEISQKSGKPIKVVFTREDDMTEGTYRPASKYKIKAAIKDGKITGYQLVEACVNANMYGVLPNNFPAGAIENYQCDNQQMSSSITIGAWRAPYTNFLASAEQGFFDEIAEMLGKDAVDLRIEILENAKRIYEKADAEYGKPLDAAKENVNVLEGRLAEAKKKEEDTQAIDESLAVAREALGDIESKVNAIKGNYDPDRMIGVIQLAAEKGNWKTEEEGVYKGFSVYYSHNTYVAQVAHMVKEGEKPVLKKVTCAVDCGIVVNPDAATNLVQGGVIDGIGHSMFGDFTFEEGKPTASNFDKFRLIRMNEAPDVDVHFVKSTENPSGLGEPTLPPAGGALVNALYKATGERLYDQPYVKATKVLG